MRCATNKVTHGADRCESHQRTLIRVAIVHTPADMGALSGSIQRRRVEKLGRKGWEHKANLVVRLWTQIESSIENLALAYPRVRIYQDGLPVCGREVEIVTELIKARSRNHQLLLHTIMGTESSELLVEEYQLVKEDFAPAIRRPSACSFGVSMRYWRRMGFSSRTVGRGKENFPNPNGGYGRSRGLRSSFRCSRIRHSLLH
ncbi:MAG TPA: hypothetical protein VG204_18340 [Terriglobia bacterium]|nr:hypothetical protein [Terriglobia bacterium]